MASLYVSRRTLTVARICQMASLYVSRRTLTVARICKMVSLYRESGSHSYNRRRQPRDFFQAQEKHFWAQISNQGLHNWVRAYCASNRSGRGSSMVSRDHRYSGSPARKAHRPHTHRHGRLRPRIDIVGAKRLNGNGLVERLVERRARRNTSSSNEKNLRRLSVKNGHIGVCCLSDNRGAR
jgi:hypothetical protein